MASEEPPYILIPFGPLANCTLDLCPIEWTVFHYRPSVAANSAFIALLFIVMCIHTFLGIRWKSWFFMGSMITGCIAEMIGYVGRILMYQNPFSFKAFMIQIVCITTAPVFFSAAIYVTIANIVVNLDASLSRIKPGLFYVIFIACDIISLTLQAVGGAMSTGSNGPSKVAINISLAGLSFQVVTLFIFCVLFIDYLTRYFRSIKGQTVDFRLKMFLGFLSLAILLILARCAYRVDELSEGYSGHLIHDESLFIGLEGVLVVCAVYCLCIGHPGYAFKELDSVSTIKFVQSDEERGMRQRK